MIPPDPVIKKRGKRPMMRRKDLAVIIGLNKGRVSKKREKEHMQHMWCCKTQQKIPWPTGI